MRFFKKIQIILSIKYVDNFWAIPPPPLVYNPRTHPLSPGGTSFMDSPSACDIYRSKIKMPILKKKFEIWNIRYDKKKLGNN